MTNKLTDEEMKKLELEDPVAWAIRKSPGRLKLIRKDGVNSPRCAAVVLTSTKDKSLDVVLNEWAESVDNHGFLVFDMIPMSQESIMLVYSNEIGEKQARVLERYGREISQKMAEMQKHDAEQEEKQLETEEAASIERNRLAAIGEQYEKRLKSVKKLPDSKEKKQLFRELEGGAAHVDILLESMRAVVREGGEVGKLAESLADKLGFGGLLKLEEEKEEEKEEEVTSDGIESSGK